MNKELYEAALQRLFANKDFHEFNIHQLAKIASAMAASEETGYTNGMRDGVIEYRKATSRGEGVV